MRPIIIPVHTGQDKFKWQYLPIKEETPSRVIHDFSGAHTSPEKLRNKVCPEGRHAESESHLASSIQSACQVKVTEDGTVVPASPVKKPPERPNINYIGRPTNNGTTFTLNARCNNTILKVISTPAFGEIEVTTFTPKTPAPGPTQSDNRDTSKGDLFDYFNQLESATPKT